MAYGYNLRPAPFGFPAVSPWPVGFQPPAPPAPIAPQPQEDPMMGGGAPGGVPAPNGPMFPGLAARFPRLAQAGQAVRGFVENFEERRPRLANFARNNSDTLSNLGMALLTTRPGDNAPVREAFYYGRQSDQARRAAQAQAEQEAEANRIWGQFLGGGQGAAPAGGAGAPPGNMQAYRDAIASIESDGSGGYQAVGPVANASGDRAYGRYQVMGSNVGPWTEQVLGRRMTPQEFLANPEAQDAVFDGIFGGYVRQYGPQGAAQAWFGGPGSVGSGGGGTDVLGTSGNEYIRRFNAALGQAGGQATAQARFTPQEQAQLQAMLSNPQTAPIAQQIIAERMFAGGGEPYTLGANEIRYGPNNEILARGPTAGETTQPARPMTEAERTLWGISPEDRRVWAVGADGPEVIGGDAPRQQELPFADEEALRDNFNAQTGDYRDIQEHFARLQAAAQNPSAAGDVAMIFAYMKMLDPSSVVRESEYATAQNAASVPEQVRALWNRILSGERLTETVRADFLNQADALFRATQGIHNQRVQAFRTLAESYGLNPDRIAPLPAPAAQPTAAGGEDTGNAADPTTWRTATNPQTGERLRFNPTTNQWEPF